MVHLLLIVVFATLFIRDGMRELWLGEHPHAGVPALGGPALLWLAAHALIWRWGRRLDRRGDFRVVGRCDVALMVSRVAAAGLHIWAVLGLGWLDQVRGWIGNLVVVDELVAAAPALAMVAGGWWSMYPIERRLREATILRALDEGRSPAPMPSRGRYVGDGLRHQAALIVIPATVLAAWHEVLDGVWERMGWRHEGAMLGMQLVGLLAVLLVMPTVLRYVWDTVRLGPGPMRDLLDGMCRSQRVRVRELLVWRTHGTMLNGAVMGIAGPLRYVLLTDALLESLSGEQVEAVMAHELGHIRRRHMIWLGVSGLAAILLASAAVGWVAWVSPWPVLRGEAAQSVLFLAGLPLAIVWIGFVSRRFEWQADAFAVQHLSGARPGAGAVVVSPDAVVAMSGALEMVARLNHIPRHRFSFRHGSIAARQRRLRSLLGRSADRLPIDRHASVLKVVSGLAFAGAIVLVWQAGVS